MKANGKRHCFFIGLPGGSDSVSSYFSAIGQELRDRGHDVILIASATNGEAIRLKQQPATLVWPSPRPTQIADGLFLNRLMREHRPSCLIANFAAVNWMCMIGWLHQVPHRIAFYHTLSTQISRDGDGSAMQMAQFRKRLVYKTATSVVASSRAALLDAQNVFGVPESKCKLCQYSMADPALKLRLRPASKRENLVVCAGRFNPSKGQDVLMAALEKVLAANDSTMVEFLGSGPTLEELQARAKDKHIANRCRFRGFVSNLEVLETMSRARLTVVPSRNEAFGLVNIESISVGTPVVASRVDGIPEVIRDGSEGYLVPPNDPEALAERVTLLVRDDGLRERLGINARQRFLDVYESRTVVKEQADWFERLVSEDPKRETNGHQ